MRIAWVAVFGLLMPLVALAHSGSASYVSLEEEAHVVHATVALELRDVQYAVGVDANEDGRITWGELKGAAAVLGAFTDERLRLSRDERACSMSFIDIAVDSIAAAPFAVLRLRYDCPSEGTLRISSDLMFDVDANHRSLIKWQHEAAKAVSILSASSRTWSAPAAGVSKLAQLRGFLVEGIWHIWTGFDHLAFLLVLLLPAFIAREGEQSRLELKRLLAIVTAFTAAHSITLILAATGTVTPPEKPIEVAIAASVVLAALMNLFSRRHSASVATAFGFGLLHGFGFAAALQGLSATRDSLALALAGFNIGVEAGQLAVVAATLPFFYWLSRKKRYASHVVPGLSLAVGALAVGWIVQRTAS